MSKKKYADAVRQHRVVAIRRKSGPKSAIERIKTQESDGKPKEWTTAKAITAMQAGTDTFFVVGLVGPVTVWSPLTPWPYDNPTGLRTETDRKLSDDLQNLPSF